MNPLSNAEHDMNQAAALGDEGARLVMAELARLRAIEARAAHLVEYYQLRDGTPWDGMTPQEGYNAGQAFAARYVLDLTRQHSTTDGGPPG